MEVWDKPRDLHIKSIEELEARGVTPASFTMAKTEIDLYSTTSARSTLDGKS